MTIQEKKELRRNLRTIFICERQIFFIGLPPDLLPVVVETIQKFEALFYLPKLRLLLWEAIL
jgi:hypothetical protein